MDFVTMNILESTLIPICREMGIVLMKTSYSTIFNEALDFTCGLADMNGDLVAVADYCPAQIGGMPLLVRSWSAGNPRDRAGGGRHRPSQRSVPRRPAHAGAHFLQTGLR